MSRSVAALQDFHPVYVRFGSKADAASSRGHCPLYPRKRTCATPYSRRQLLAKAAIRNLARRKQRDAGNGEPHIRAIFRFLKREFKYDSPGNNQAARNQNGLEKT